MRLSMDVAGVREVLHHQPFQPFLIRLADVSLDSMPEKPKGGNGSQKKRRRES